MLLGLSIILPLISLELLKFPKLCHLYFTLLSYIMEVYTDQVAELAPPHFSTLMHSLEFGLQHSDPLVAQASLEGLAGEAGHAGCSKAQGCSKGGALGLFSVAGGVLASCQNGWVLHQVAKLVANQNGIAVA